MEPYVKATDLYQFKLALILGRGKRLKKLLRNFPTERKFKDASLEEISNVIGIANKNSDILNKLSQLDTTYDKMVTFKPNPHWSRTPGAKRIMGIDTEYLKSDLDSIQYVVLENLELLTSGFIFTNDDLAHSLSLEDGVNYLRGVIYDTEPELIVGHNFNSDISILESAYGNSLPELYYYDDTMDLMEDSQLSNIIGGSSLNNAIKEIFNGDVVGLFSAYKDLGLFMEYGIKDAIYPILLRHYVINGEIPQLDFELSIEKILKEKNRSFLKKDRFKLNLN